MKSELYVEHMVNTSQLRDLFVKYNIDFSEYNLKYAINNRYFPRPRFRINPGRIGGFFSLWDERDTTKWFRGFEEIHPNYNECSLKLNIVLVKAVSKHLFGKEYNSDSKKGWPSYHLENVSIYKIRDIVSELFDDKNVNEPILIDKDGRKHDYGLISNQDLESLTSTKPSGPDLLQVLEECAKTYSAPDARIKAENKEYERIEFIDEDEDGQENVKNDVKNEDNDQRCQCCNSTEEDSSTTADGKDKEQRDPIEEMLAIKEKSEDTIKAAIDVIVGYYLNFKDLKYVKADSVAQRYMDVRELKNHMNAFSDIVHSTIITIDEYIEQLDGIANGIAKGVLRKQPQ